jgi:hypothetical protein
MTHVSLRTLGVKAIAIRALAIALAFAAAATRAWQAEAGRELITFPENFAEACTTRL